MAALVDYDSDSSGGESGAAPAPATAAAPKLPSALDLLSADAPGFLSQRSSKEEVDYRVVSKRLEAEAEAASPPDARPPAAGAGQHDAPAGAAPSGVGAKRPREDDRPTAAAAAPATAAGGAAAAPPKGAPGKAADGKPAAAAGDRLGYKDRVKHQRLAGQSGIGADFRTWRSDEEMALRQQFDG